MSFKPSWLFYEYIAGLSDVKRSVCLSERDLAIINAFSHTYEWPTRWVRSFDDYSPIFSTAEKQNIKRWAESVNLSLDTNIGNDCGGESSECERCVTYTFDDPSIADFITFEPISPFDSAWLPSFPYLANPWNITQLPEAGGILPNDLLVNVSGVILSALNPIDFAGVVPYLAFWVNGATSVKLTMIERPQGGFAVLSVDGTIQEFLDLQSFGFGEIETYIDVFEDYWSAITGSELLGEVYTVDVKLPDTSAHRIALTFIPRFQIAPLPIGIGGGIRSIEVCGDDAELTIIPEFRIVDCNLEVKRAPNLDWEVLGNVCGDDGAAGQTPPTPIFAFDGTTLTIDSDADGNVDVTSPDLKGDAGSDGECPDCGETPPITQEDIENPDYPQRVCGGATLLANSVIDGYIAALQEAIDGVNGGNLPLSAYGLAQASLAAVVLASGVSGQWYATAGAAAGMVALKAYYDDAPSVVELQQYQTDIEAVRQQAIEVLYCSIIQNEQLTQELYWLWLGGLSSLIAQSVPFDLVGAGTVQWNMAVEIYYLGWLDNASSACDGYCQTVIEADYCKDYDLTTQVGRDAWDLPTGDRLSTGFRAGQYGGTNQYWDLECELTLPFDGEVVAVEVTLDAYNSQPVLNDYIQVWFDNLIVDSPYPYVDPTKFEFDPPATTVGNSQLRIKLARRNGIPFGQENPIANRYLLTRIRLWYNDAQDNWPTVPSCS